MVANLEDQIAAARRKISSDSYPMSVGELTNLYREGELVIRPAFQRLYRWTASQKSALIESVLLGIPLPSIFVAQREDGKWEVVDGLQRISTLLELQGLLEMGGVLRPQLKLAGTKYLPALEGKRWEISPESLSLSPAQRLDIKRAKIDVKIIKRDSSPETKYDLFARLNSFGSTLTAQEMRSALLVSVDPSFFEWVEELSQDENFVSTTALSDRLTEEQYDIELILRFLVLHKKTKINSGSLKNFTDVLTNDSIVIAEKFPEFKAKHEFAFYETFSLLGTFGPDVFRKWDSSKREFVGGFLNTAFEIVAIGLGWNLRKGVPHRTDIPAVVKALWARPEMKAGFATGMATETRLARMLPIGRQITAK